MKTFWQESQPMPFFYLASAVSVQLFVDLHDKVILIIFNLHLFLYLLQV